MKRTIILLVMLSLAICGFSQKIKRFDMAWCPTFSYRIASVPMKVTTADGTVLDAKRLPFLNIKNGPPYIGGAHLGLDAVCIFPMSHVGFDVLFNYHRFGISMTYPGNNEKTNHITNSIVPEINLRIVLGDQLQHIATPVIYLGAAYNYHFSYKGDFDDTRNQLDAVSNGFEGVIGLGLQVMPGFAATYTSEKRGATFSFTSSHDNLYMSLALMYRYCFYDYFNQEYYYRNNNYPFSGFSSRFGEIFFRLTMGLRSK